MTDVTLCVTLLPVIRSWGNKATEDLAHDKASAQARRIPAQLRRSALRKLALVHRAASLADLRVPPGNRLEALRGDWAGFHSIRINEQFRIVFRWEKGDAFDVQIVDYH